MLIAVGLFTGPAQACVKTIQENLGTIIKYQQPARIPFEFRHGENAGAVKSIPVYQPALQPLIQEAVDNGLSEDWIKRVRTLLLEKGVFEIPIEKNGAVIASGVDPHRGDGNGGGGMGTAVWGRDMIRAVRGAMALGRREDARKMVLHILSAMSTGPQLERIRENIRYPAHHLAGPMTMPRVRWDGKTLGEVMVPNPKTGKLEVQPWNHMQFDFYVGALRTVMTALRDGLINEADITGPMRAFLIGMAALPLRLQYWKVHTSDAWEEGMTVRTSTLIQQSTFYWMYLSGLQGNEDAAEFSSLLETWIDEKPNAYFDRHTVGIIRRTLSPEVVLNGITEAEAVIEKQLPLGESPFGNSGPQTKRHEDAALLHSLWFESIRLISSNAGVIRRADLDTILGHVKKLEGDSGIARYDRDVYLMPFFWAKSGEFIPPQFNRSRKPVLATQLKEAFWQKDGAFVEELFGKDFMAQWSLHDPMKSSIYGDLALFNKDNDSFKELQLYHLLRSLGQISGTRAPDGPIIAADGLENKSWELPEAYILLRIFGPAGEMLEEHHLPCPHSPLYWSVSELARALFIGEKVVAEEAHRSRSVDSD